MIYRTSDAEIKAYMENPAMNQSRLKTLAESVHIFNEYGTEEEADLYYSEKDHFILGNAGDCLATLGPERFNEKFHISQIQNKPGEKALAIIHQVFDEVKDAAVMNPDLRNTTFEEHRMLIYQACNDNDYYLKQAKQDWEEDNRWKRIVGSTEEAQQVVAIYWKDLMNSVGMQVLTSEQYSTVSTIISSWYTHPVIGKYFDGIDAIDGMDIIYQLPLYFEFMDMKCKALLDKVDIHHAANLIYFWDLKIIGDKTYNFLRTLRRFRYDFQNVFYHLGINTNGAKQKISEILGQSVMDYDVQLPGWIVGSSKYPGLTPRMYSMNWRLYNEALDGVADRFVEHTNNGKIRFPGRKGVKDCMDIYKWHLQNGFEEDMDVILREHFQELEWNKIL